jgi:hypothetical protein
VCAKIAFLAKRAKRRDKRVSRIIRSPLRVRLDRIVIILVSLTVAFLISGAERSLAGGNATATLNVVYNANGTVSITLPDGTSVGTPSAPGTVIPPGTYSIVFNNKAQVVHLFHLAGPGVKLSTDLRPIGEDAMCAGITGLYSLQTYEETFLPNSTYVFQDDYQPNAIHGVFSTSGSSSTVATSSGTQQSNTGSGHVITGTSSSVSGLASNGTTSHGVLAASVGTTGALSLTYKGKHIAKLQAGRYTITVTDKSSKDGFMLQKASRSAVVVATAGFVGQRSRKVDLTTGQWFFYPTASAKKTSFIVSS